MNAAKKNRFAVRATDNAWGVCKHYRGSAQGHVVETHKSHETALSRVVEFAKAEQRLALPAVPTNPVDIFNRAAIATGSYSAAMSGANSDYNGHNVSIDYRPDAIGGPRWVCSYTWSGIQRVARGTFKSVLDAAARYHARAQRGATMTLSLSAEDPTVSVDEQIALATEAGFTVEDAVGRDDQPWWTVNHAACAHVLYNAPRSGRGRAPRGEDIDFALKHEGTIEEFVAAYEAKRKARRGL